MLVDDQLRPGGSLRSDPRSGRGVAEARWDEVNATGVEVLARATAIGYFPEDGGGVLAVAAPARLYRVHAKRVDVGDRRLRRQPADRGQRSPGVIAARAVGRMLVDHGILAGDKIAIVEVPEVAAECAALAGALDAAGAEVERVPVARRARDARPRLGVARSTRRTAASSAMSSRSPRFRRRPPKVRASKAVAVVLDADLGGFEVAVDRRWRMRSPQRVGVRRCHRVQGHRPRGADGRASSNVAASLDSAEVKA